MRKKLWIALCLLLFWSGQAQPPANSAWQGKRVGYIGDSITDPNCCPGVKLYWEFLAEWLQITPFVTAVSGREWNDVPHLQSSTVHLLPSAIDPIAPYFFQYCLY